MTKYLCRGGISINRLIILIFIFTFSFLLRLWNINEIGRTWDEAEYIEPGYKLVELLKKRDFDNSYFYTTYNHPPLVKYLYGLTAHLDVESVRKDGSPIFRYDYTYSRLLSAILFSLGVAIVVMIGWKISTPLVGISSGIILAMLPFSLGLSQLVTTESLKIFIYPLTIYVYILLIERFSWKRVLFAGIVTGLALQTKQSNFLVIPILGTMFFFQYKQLKTDVKSAFVKTRVKAILSVLSIGIIVFVMIWPQFLFHFMEVYEIHSRLWNVQFSPKIWQITLSPPEVFFGRLVLTPIFYYIVYFFITIPLLILCLFFIGVKEIFNKKNMYLLSILLWFILPFSLSIYSWRQHGLRYIIEIYPAITIIAAIGFNTLMDKFKVKEKIKLFYLLPIVIYLFTILLSIKPYYLDYFNELVGGINTVYKHKLFQIGWWGQGIREAGLYLVKNAPKGSSVGLALSPIHSAPPMPELDVQAYDNRYRYDYVIVNFYNVLREGFDDSLIKKAYKPIYFVKADEAILVTVYKLK